MSQDKNPNADEKVFVKIEKDKFDTILERLEKLEKDVSGVNELKPVATSTARMRKLDGKIVIGFEGKNWTVYDKEKREEQMWANFLLIDKNGKKSTKKMDYKDFLELSEVIEVEVIRQHVRVEKPVSGETAVKEVVDYKTVETGEYVPLVVETPVVTAFVDLPEIGEYELSVDSLNI